MTLVYPVTYACPIQVKGGKYRTYEKFAVQPEIKRIFDSEEKAMEYVNRKTANFKYDTDAWQSELKPLPGTDGEEWYWEEYWIGEYSLN